MTRSRQINERSNRNFTNQTNLNFEFRTGSLSHFVGLSTSLATKVPMTHVAYKDSGVGVTLSQYGFDRMTRTRGWHFHVG